MNRVGTSHFSDVTHGGGNNHGSDVDWEGHAGLGQKIRKDCSQTDCKDQLEYRRRVHIGMTLMLFLFLD